MQILIFIALLVLVPEISLAGGVFVPPATDQSIGFLGHVLGPRVGAVFLGGSANPTLYHMFEMFNTTVISIGTVIISYIGTVSTMNTAQEGQAMGRKWSSIWIPMRSTMGMGLLIPTPHSGYSVVQTTVMWLIMQGVGAADQIWNKILQDLGHGFSATMGVQRPANTNTNAGHIYQNLEIDGDYLARSVLNAGVCMHAMRKMLNPKVNDRNNFNTPKNSLVKANANRVKPYETVTNVSGNDREASKSGLLRIGIPNDAEFHDVCGSFTVTGNVRRTELDAITNVTPKLLSEKAELIYRHKINALNDMLASYKPIIDYIVDESPYLQPRDANNRLTDPVEAIYPGGYRAHAMKAYRENLATAVKPQHLPDMQAIIRQGMDNGWIAAGSFYFTLNQMREVDFFDDIKNAPTPNKIPYCDAYNNCHDIFPDNGQTLQHGLEIFLQNVPEKTYMANILWDAKVYYENDLAMMHEQLSPRAPPHANNQDNPFYELQHEALNMLDVMMREQHADPLIAQGKFGASIMLLSERAWRNPQAELHELINRAENGYSPLSNELLQRINELKNKSSMAVAIYGVIWIVGATLAIYIPLIPYMIFTIGVVGWMLMVIEAVVAAPILAIGFMLPGGDELGKVGQGLMLLLGILLRPVLMLFGFVLATRLYQAVVKMVNYGMLNNFSFLDTGGSMFAWVAVLTLYGTFIVTLGNKSFSLIYALPDKVLRWMGTPGEHSDVSQDLHQAKGAMLKGAETVNKVSSGIPERELVRLQNRANQLIPADAIRSDVRT